AFDYFSSAHEGTVSDLSAFFTPFQPPPAGTHIILYLSRSKHATYFGNPDGVALVPAYIRAAVYAALAFLYFSGQIDFLTYLVLLAPAAFVVEGCILDHYGDQGISFVMDRTNVGEPDTPINGSHYIQDRDPALGLYPKLTSPLWIIQ